MKHWKHRDGLDMDCEEWAAPRRRIYGVTLDKMIEPRERIGKLRSTLAAVREEGEGAAYGRASQNWAEVYTPTGMLIHRCFMTMSSQMRDTMQLHYVFDLDQWPLAKRCADYGTTVHMHWVAVAEMKIYLNGFLAGHSIPDDDDVYARSARR